MAASEYNLTGNEYCQLMLQKGTWGGGPEIIAISNLLQCPIQIYQAKVSSNHSNSFILQKVCCFGSDFFSSNRTINLLFVPGQFPEIPPDDFDMLTPDHFLALFEFERDSEENIEIDRSLDNLNGNNRNLLKRSFPPRLFQGRNWRRRA